MKLQSLQTVFLIPLFTVAFSLCGFSQTVPNPSFEMPGFPDANPFIILPSGSGFITGWTVGGAGLDYFKSPPAGAPASDGFYFVDLVRGPGQGGSISTTATGLTLGNFYNLTFDIQQGAIEPGTVITAMADSSTAPFLNTTPNVWATHSLMFLATASTVPISFSGPSIGGDDVDVFVDNVRIESILSVPEPGGIAVGILAIGYLAITHRVRRRQA